jgi:L,D-peptidoglycan transpeptidase YkuD (ErfK/YbiS/YcfS/YnhG family)
MGHVTGGKPLKKADGWCDAKGHGRYNRAVTLPFAASHENMWRQDEAYDLVCLTSHNQRPRVQGLGSAIFLHIWREGSMGTEGCVALKEADLRRVLAKCRGTTYLVI